MTQEQKELANSFLDYLDRLSPSILTLCDDVRMGNLHNIDTLGDIFEGFKWVIDAFTVLNNECSLNKYEDTVNFKNQLDEIVQKLEDRDYIYVADLLEYEIIPILEAWFEEVKQIG